MARLIALYIVGGIIFLLALLSLLRVGVFLEYGGEKALLLLRIGWFRFRISSKRRKEPKKPKQPAHLAEKKEKPKKGGPLKTLRRLLPILSEGVGRLREKLQVDLLEMEYWSGGKTPAQAAIGFGMASAAFGIFLPILENTFCIKKKVLHAGVCYDQKQSSIYLKLSLSLHVFQIVSLAVWFGVQYWRQGKQSRKIHPNGENRKAYAS